MSFTSLYNQTIRGLYAWVKRVHIRRAVCVDDGSLKADFKRQSSAEFKRIPMSDRPVPSCCCKISLSAMTAL